MDVATFGPPVLKAIKKSIESSLSILEKISPVDDTLKTLIADYKKLHEMVTSDIDNISKYNITTFPTRVNDINSKEEALDARRVSYLQPITGPKVVTIYTILADIWTDMKNNATSDTKINGDINSKLEILNKSSLPYKVSDKVISNILNSRTAGITFSQVLFNKKLADGTASLEVYGSATNRDSLRTFKTALDNNPEFSSVDLPISNFLGKTNLNFTISLIMK
jgi:hypothetical protein